MENNRRTRNPQTHHYSAQCKNCKQGYTIEGYGAYPDHIVLCTFHAAAPELLDACRKALSAIQTLATVIPAGQLGNEKFVFAETIEEEIEAAIAKAEASQ